MKPFFVLPLAASARQLSPAGPADRAIVAAMHLADAANYCWGTTFSDDART